MGNSSANSTKDFTSKKRMWLLFEMFKFLQLSEGRRQNKLLKIIITTIGATSAPESIRKEEHQVLGASANCILSQVPVQQQSGRKNPVGS